MVVVLFGIEWEGKSRIIAWALETCLVDYLSQTMGGCRIYWFVLWADYFHPVTVRYQRRAISLAYMNYIGFDLSNVCQCLISLLLLIARKA